MAFFIPVFEQLNKANVQYVAVGGVATILHGYVLATTDIDLIVDLQVDEAEKRSDWINTKGMTVFSMFHAEQPGLSVDLFAKHPIPFGDLWKRSQIFEVDGTNI